MEMKKPPGKGVCHDGFLYCTMLKGLPVECSWHLAY
jgi:hypothetical protein